MLKLHHFFFINVLGLFIGAFALAALISFVTLKTIVIDNYELKLQQDIKLIELQLPFASDLDEFVYNLHKTIALRVTMVDTNGKVIAESNKNKEELDNHANRREIKQLDVNEFGKCIRFSHTLNRNFLYVAKQVTYNNRELILRLSVSLSTVMENFYSLFIKLVLAFSSFIVIAIVMTVVMSRRISHDVKQISFYLEEISNKNYKAVLKTQYFSEFLEIALSLKNLVKKLNHRDKQRRKYTAKLRLINKQRTDILSAISHEFKNPIASIMGYAETIHDDDDIEPKMRKRFLGKILSNAQKITSMIDRVALSIKLENRDLEPEKTEFGLCDLSQEVMLNISKKYPDRVINFSGDNFRVFADKTMIENVIINLVDNAMKYSQDDVLISIIDNKLLVIDKGIGLEEKDIEKVSSKFYRVDKNTWDNSMGLGLAIVSYILRLHDTELIIESREGEGSIFGFDCTKCIR